MHSGSILTLHRDTTVMFITRPHCFRHGSGICACVCMRVCDCMCTCVHVRVGEWMSVWCIDMRTSIAHVHARSYHIVVSLSFRWCPHTCRYTNNIYNYFFPVLSFNVGVSSWYSPISTRDIVVENKHLALRFITQLSANLLNSHLI